MESKVEECWVKQGATEGEQLRQIASQQLQMSVVNNSMRRHTGYNSVPSSWLRPEDGTMVTGVTGLSVNGLPLTSDVSPTWEELGKLQAERDALQNSHDRVVTVLRATYCERDNLLVEIAALKAQLKDQGINHVVAQHQTPNTTYTVFATNPNTVQVDPNHTPSDVKHRPPAEPKPLPSGALKTNLSDRRMIGR